MGGRRDFVEEMVAERTKANPRFPELLEAAARRRELFEALSAEREAQGLSQTVVAARMRTSQSAVARIEQGEADVKLSTVERYAAAIGRQVHWELVDT